MTTPFDKTAYRQALGGFPTGVCVISTYDANGVPLGITANSFTSVSMDPPLLLWCPSQSSSRHEVFVKTPHFAINVLCHSDEHLAKAIAADGHKITDAGLRASNGKAPVIENCVAVFECKQHATHAAGDHRSEERRSLFLHTATCAFVQCRAVLFDANALEYLALILKIAFGKAFCFEMPNPHSVRPMPFGQACLYHQPIQERFGR